GRSRLHLQTSPAPPGAGRDPRPARAGRGGPALLVRTARGTPMGGEEPVRATLHGGRARRLGLASAAGAAALLTTVAGCGIEPTGVQVVGEPPAARAAGTLP